MLHLYFLKVRCMHGGYEVAPLANGDR
jgi:hypothetical protein